jgi:hypothetical protein
MVKLFRQKGIRKKEKREKESERTVSVQNCFFGNKLAFSRHFRTCDTIFAHNNEEF